MGKPKVTKELLAKYGFKSVSHYTYSGYSGSTCEYCGDRSTRRGDQTGEVLCDTCIDGYTEDEIREMINNGKV